MTLYDFLWISPIKNRTCIKLRYLQIGCSQVFVDVRLQFSPSKILCLEQGELESIGWKRVRCSLSYWGLLAFTQADLQQAPHLLGREHLISIYPPVTSCVLACCAIHRKNISIRGYGDKYKSEPFAVFNSARCHRSEFFAGAGRFVAVPAIECQVFVQVGDVRNS